MNRLGLAGFVALIAGCGGAGKYAARPSPPMDVATATGGAVAPGTTAMADDAGAPATTDPTGTGTTGAKIAASQPAAGQLTAGVWDDNQNFNFFAPYAKRMAGSQDLGAFGADEQLAAHDAFAQLSRHTGLDVQLVLDTTGSMGDELTYLQSEFDSIAAQVKQRFPNVTPRWSLIVYRDDGDEYVTRHADFMTDTAKFRKLLANQEAGGGGDFPEAVIKGLGVGLDQTWSTDDGVARLMFWVADAPPHDGEGGKLAALARRAQKLGVHVYPVASSGIDDPTEYQMRATAQLTGGRYLFLTDDSGIGNSHEIPHIPCYAVTRLDRAVVRMIDSELTGQRADIADDDVVRQVGNPDAEGKCSVGGTEMVVAF